mmetsp:Transcript_105171/g.327896  ORF Transcript_105171/g.327896 Transcript_105171/m.327896 type:complete len:254 (-) Transcript_105171:148-909(-)
MPGSRPAAAPPLAGEPRPTEAQPPVTPSGSRGGAGPEAKEPVLLLLCKARFSSRRFSAQLRSEAHRGSSSLSVAMEVAMRSSTSTPSRGRRLRKRSVWISFQDRLEGGLENTRLLRLVSWVAASSRLFSSSSLMVSSRISLLSRIRLALRWAASSIFRSRSLTDIECAKSGALMFPMPASFIMRLLSFEAAFASIRRASFASLMAVLFAFSRACVASWRASALDNLWVKDWWRPCSVLIGEGMALSGDGGRAE